MNNSWSDTDRNLNLVPEQPDVHINAKETEGSAEVVWIVRSCGSGARSGPGRPGAWRPASSSAGLVPAGGKPVRSSELEEDQ